jgi:uncharacterized lipoprotein YmbA
MKKVFTILALATLTACASTPMTPAELAASHAREEQRNAIEQDKRALTMPSSVF